MISLEKKHYLRFIGWFFLVNAFFYLILGLSYLQTITNSTTLFKNLVFEYSTWSGKLFVLVFVVTTYFSYMLFLAFIPALASLLLCLILPRKMFVTTISILFATVFAFLLIVDVKVFSMFKFHLSLPIFKMLLSTGIQDLLDLSRYELQLFTASICGICLLESCLAWLVWKYIVIPRRLLYGRSVATAWFAAVLFSYFSMMLSLYVQHNNLLTQQAANLPYYNNFLAYLVPKKNAKEMLNRYSEGHYMQAQFARDKLNYPRKPMNCQVTAQKPYNIIFIMVDSLRFDSLKYMPHTAKFAEQSWNFLQNYSGGNSTQAGLFTLFYSIPSSYWTAALEQEVAPVFIEQLLANNYSTAVFWSSEMYNPPMHKTIYNKLQGLELDTVKSSSLSDWDRSTTQKAVAYLEKVKNQQQPFFLNIFYNAPHAFCRTQDFPQKYKPVAEVCSRLYLHNNSDPKPFFNSYLNTLDFIDLEINKVLQKVADSSLLGNSIVIITSDHGQEFNENHLNYWWHASNYTDYQVRVPLIIHWPHAVAQRIQHITTHYDLMPTILGRSFNCRNSFADYSIGQDLLVKKRNLKFVLAGSYVNNGIIEADRITTLHRSGEITITDSQLNPLYATSPRIEVLNKSLQMMREYYEHAAPG